MQCKIGLPLLKFWNNQDQTCNPLYKIRPVDIGQLNKWYIIITTKQTKND